MTDIEKTELYWAYAISRERVVKQLLEKGIASQRDADEALQKLYDNIHRRDITKFSMSQNCKDILETYLRKVPPKKQYLSLTDIARGIEGKSPGYVIQAWLRNRNTIELLRI